MSKYCSNISENAVSVMLNALLMQQMFFSFILNHFFFLLFCRSAFDLVNIHLFHDASNLIAWETSPSVYSGIRHKALGYVLDRYVLAFTASLNLLCS